WFGHVAELDDIQAFEPREFLAGPDHVTVLGWERTHALPVGGVYETDWGHVFNVRNGKVTRFVGMYDTAASAAARRGVVRAVQELGPGGRGGAGRRAPPRLGQSTALWRRVRCRGPRGKASAPACGPRPRTARRCGRVP